MITDTPALMKAIRSRFAHVETCPKAGPRIFFENAGGALTLNSVVQTTAHYAAIPDNQGRDNPMSKELQHALLSRSGAIIISKHNDTAAGSSAAHGMWLSMHSSVQAMFYC